MSTDHVADMLSSIRNAYKAQLPLITLPFSNLLVNISKVLEEEGFIRTHRVTQEGNKKNLVIELKYIEGEPAVKDRPTLPVVPFTADQEDRSAEEHGEQGDELALEEGVHDGPDRLGGRIERPKDQRIELQGERVCDEGRVDRQNAEDPKPAKHVEAGDAVCLRRHGGPLS